MGQIKIFTDSTNDLPLDVLKQHDISVVPLSVRFEEQIYRDGVDITSDKLFAKVDETGRLPKTSAPAPDDFSRAFKPYIEQGQDIIYLGLSSQLSSTVQNAIIAAGDFPQGRIQVVDSLNVSTALGLLVLKACDFAALGLGVAAIAENLRSLVPKLRTTLIIDTLEYIYKGGRCSALQNLLGGILKIRPILKIAEGKVIVGQKTRGKRGQAVDALLAEVLQNRDEIDTQRVMVTHASAYNDAVYIQAKLQAALNIKECLLSNAGCVISSHCGPNTVGILYIAK